LCIIYHEKYYLIKKNKDKIFMITKDDVIFITGGSGFIGTNLIELLEKKEYNIINFDKDPPINKEQSHFWVKGNILNKPDIENAFSKHTPSIVIHLAARTDTLSDKIEDYAENTEGTTNIIEVIKLCTCVKHLLVASTQYVYKSKEMPFSLKDDDYKPHTVYGESKKITEEITRRSDLKCKWTIIRPCNVWGPWHMRYPDELWKVISKGYYVHPSKKPVIRTYAYVKNLVYQLESILNAEDSLINQKTFYLGDMPMDSYLWLNEFSQQLRRKNIIRIPKCFFWCGAIIGNVFRRIGINFPLYSMRYRNMIEDFYAPSNITVNMFGVYNANCADNVTETIEWLKRDGIQYFNYWRQLFEKKQN